MQDDRQDACPEEEPEAAKQRQAVVGSGGGGLARVEIAQVGELRAANVREHLEVARPVRRLGSMCVFSLNSFQLIRPIGVR